MNRMLWGLALLLGALGRSAAAQLADPRQLSVWDAWKAKQWAKQVEDFLDRDDLANALQLAEKLHQLHRDKQGSKHWQTWNARFLVREVNRLQQRPAEERQRL